MKPATAALTWVACALLAVSCSGDGSGLAAFDDDAPSALLDKDPRSIELAGNETGLLGSTPENEEFEAAAEDERFSGRCIVVLRRESQDPSVVAAELASRHAFTVGRLFRHALRGFSLDCPEALRDRLAIEPDVQYVHRDRVYAQEEPFAPQRVKPPQDEQVVPTGIRRMGAAGLANKGTGIHVAVLDTGIEGTHPDLEANVVGGYNCAEDAEGTDPTAWGPVGDGHGTHVAGTIAAADDGNGVVGIAPEAKLWSMRVFSAEGKISDIVLACALEAVACLSPGIQDTTGCPESLPREAGPIRVVNMSLGGPRGQEADDGDCGNQNGDAFHQAVCSVVGLGVTVVVAAGNGTLLRGIPRNVRFWVPAAYDEALTVTALADSDGAPCGKGAATSSGKDDTFADFSNYATQPQDVRHLIAAPGVDILSTWLEAEGGYDRISGTSMASPHVAGLAALYIRRKFVETGTYPSPAEVRSGLRDLGEPFGQNFNAECGSGKLPSHSAEDNHPGRFFPHVERVGRGDGL